MPQLLNDSVRASVYLDKDDRAGSTVFKIANQAKLSYKCLQNEFDLLSVLQVPGIRKPLKKLLFDNKEAFGYSYFDGTTLKAFIHENDVSLSWFLEFAVNIVEILDELHSEGVAHLMINANNILLNPETNDILLIDFGTASRIDASLGFDPDYWSNELVYAAPEQLNEDGYKADPRTDLYSLGLVFYEILAKKLPFAGSKESDIVHSILVRKPDILRDVNPDIPKVLSDIIGKLLSKNPDKRYQSMHGLLWDLSQCKEMHGRNEELALRSLAEKDSSSQFIYPEKLYNRDEQLARLKEGFNRTCNGENVHFLIRGETGSGKTALFRQFQRKIVGDNGLVISGTFERSDRISPNRGIISALRDFSSQILSLPKERQEEWKTLLNHASGDIGQILIDLIPEYEWIMGAQPQTLDVTATQAMNRMDFLFQRILQEIATLNRPVVLFMDNLQWAETAAIRSICSLLQDRSIKHFMFVGVINTQLDDEKQLRQFKEQIPDITELEVENLQVEDIKNLLADILTTHEVEDLCNIIHAKTHGNPFYVKKLLSQIQAENILKYSPVLTQWTWDKKLLSEVQASENVIQFLHHKITLLSEGSREVLFTCSCIGMTFDAKLLNAVLLDSANLGELLSELIKEGFIQSVALGEYKFVSHKTLEVVQDSFAHISSAEIHLRIVRELLANSLGEGQDFTVARHFRECLSIIPPDLRIVAIKYIAGAGKFAAKSADFDLAYDYFRSAINLSKESDWEDNYELILDLYNIAAEAGMITGEEEQSRAWLDLSLTKAENITDRIKAHEIILNHLTESHQFAATIEQLLSVLDEIGYGIKRNPSKVSILKELVLVKWLLRGKSSEDIMNLPSMEDERALAFMRLTVNATTSIFGYAPDILPIVFFRLVRLSLKYGNSSYSPFGYVSYGFAISVFLNQVEQGYEFGRLSLALTDKLNAQVVKTKVMVSFYGFLAYWKDSLRTAIEPLREAYMIGRQTGDLLYASFAASFHSGIRLYAGENLEVLLPAMTQDCETIKNLNQELVYQVSELQRQFVLNLLNQKKDQLLFDSEGFEEQQFLAKLEEIGDEATKFDFYYYKLFLAFLFNDYEVAKQNADEAADYEEETTSRQITYPSYLLCKALSECMILLESKKFEKKYTKEIKKKVKALERVSKLAPQNFANKVLFLKAMLARIEGKDNPTELFKQAVEASIESGFINEEAMVREHFAYYYYDQGLKENGDMMLTKAYQCYNNWGAKAKCRQLEDKFKTVLGEGSKQDQASFQNIFDFNTLINANQVLSSENTLTGLLNRSLEIFLNNAKISKVVIALNDNDGNLQIKGLGDDEGLRIFDTDPEEIVYPESAVNYVVRSNSVLVSDNFTNESKYKFDPYIQKFEPKSICVVPIKSKNMLIGIIYLENNNQESAFDSNRVEFYNTIAAQFAISLDNVLLYRDLEDKVRERTEEIREKNELLTVEKQKSDELLLNILPGEVAQELKDKGSTTARHYDNVTILFSDIKDFTTIAEQMTPSQLVGQLHKCFTEFDRICRDHGLEKIKTVGDAYIAAGGVPSENTATAKNVVSAAIDMQKYIEKVNAEENFFKVRIGIHTGPVVAGVVGSKKFQFDIWGESVNLAARMEQASEPGRINVSKSTYSILKDEFKWLDRGMVEIKNNRKVQMYYLDQ